MAQHDYQIADQPGASFLSDLNAALAAIVSQNSGATEPTLTYPYQWWADTTSGKLKLRNAANSAWIEVGTLGSANLGLQVATAALGALGALTPAANQLPYFSGANSAALATLTAFARTLLDDPDAATARATLGAAAAGAVTSSGITMSSSRLLGRTTAGSGAVEEITVGAGLSLSAGVLASAAVLVDAPATVNLKANTVGPFQVNVTCDVAVLTDGVGNSFRVFGVNVTPDITVSGAGGLDTGTEQASQFYYVWLIATPGGAVNGLFSLSPSAPVMPTGYSYRALVGAVKNDASSNFEGFFQRGPLVMLAPRKLALFSGTATAETSVSIAERLPPIAHTYILHVAASRGGGSATTTLFLRASTGFDSASVSLAASTGVGFRNDAVVELPHTTTQAFYYLWDTTDGTAAANIYLLGFRMPGLLG